MTKKEQKAFVRDLSRNIAREICEQIAHGRVPEDWNGMELRLLLAERHKQSARMCGAQDRRSRAWREFARACIINNL